MKKYALISLGCPKNLVDSEIFANITENSGFSQTENPEEAEVIIVNTCGFIIDAKQESIDTILEMADYKESGKCEQLIVTGCLARRYFDDLKNSMPEIDHLIDLKDFNSFASIFGDTNPTRRKLLTPAHFAYIRISDGCNNHCSYCAIPGIRGELNSNPMEEVLEEATRLASQGVKELIVTAQDTTQYGIDLYGEPKLVELLRKLHQIEGFEWIRLLYLHPAHITSELIDTIAELPKICNYFEIPLQHINNEILNSMNRKVTKERIISIIDEIRTKIPDAVIRTTFIVGYPGETQEQFEELKTFISDYRFGRLGVFTYSHEEDTPAFDLPNEVPEDIAEARKDELMRIQQQISSEYLADFIGKKIKVIIDKIGDDGEFPFEGRSYFDAPEIDGTVFISEGNAQLGDIVEVEVVDAWEYDLIADIVN